MGAVKAADFEKRLKDHNLQLSPLAVSIITCILFVCLFVCLVATAYIHVHVRV